MWHIIERIIDNVKTQYEVRIKNKSCVFFWKTNDGNRIINAIEKISKKYPNNKKDKIL